MKNIRHEIAIWFQGAIFLILWAGVIFVTEHELKITLGAVWAFPKVVVLYMIVQHVFTHWAWRWRRFQGWLVPVPNLQGTWKGQLISTWINPATQSRLPPIDALLVIRHSFASVSCTLLTAESESRSLAASIEVNEESGQRDLNYNYLNTPRVGVRDRSERHAGAVMLKLAVGPPLRLSGEYFTSRKTTGEMEFLFTTRECVDTFDTPLS